VSPRQTLAAAFVMTRLETKRSVFIPERILRYRDRSGTK